VRDILLLKLLFDNKVLCVLSAFCILTLASCDKQEKLYNRWNLQSVLMNGQPINDTTQFNLRLYYTNYYFYYENSLNVSTYAKGSLTETADGFYQLEKKSMLFMRFTILYQSYKIRAKIKKLTKKEMHLEYTDNGNKYLMKLYTN
jgi:hypothetical protein